MKGQTGSQKTGSELGLSEHKLKPATHATLRNNERKTANIVSVYVSIYEKIKNNFAKIRLDFDMLHAVRSGGIDFPLNFVFFCVRRPCSKSLNKGSQ